MVEHAASATVVDIFGDAAPGRSTRPALYRARAAWAPRRSAVDLGLGPLVTVCGLSRGDTVLLQVSPGVYRAGVIIEWRRAQPGNGPMVTGQAQARVRLDLAQGEARPTVVSAPRWRLTPYTSKG